MPDRPEAGACMKGALYLLNGMRVVVMLWFCFTLSFVVLGFNL